MATVVAVRRALTYWAALIILIPTAAVILAVDGVQRLHGALWGER